ncbi:hypothetical protein D5018_13710 [Parashewanella curva]|uniref:Uncharacterized protein n=1 Tax=Parashewanella curva TaxID=2338552 RepID=A0A3L8PUM9_9GAMM|nr:hypothetical protein [Parashewanella curva]RLV59125.1 hypothetical protein D5018_13710 [Parashewanella curva]
MRIRQLGLACFVLFISNVVSAENIFTPFPDSKLKESEQSHFIHKKFIGAIEKGKIKPLVKSGALERFGYVVDRSHEPSNIFQNHLEQLKKQNAEIIFTCQPKAVDDSKKLNVF